MTIALTVSDHVTDEVDVVALPVFAELVPASNDVVLDGKNLRLQNFTGKLGETLIRARATAGLELLVGLGTPADLDAEAFRRVGAAIARATKRCTRGAISLSGLSTADLHAAQIAESIGVGFLLASYSFEDFRSEPTAGTFVQLDVLGDDGDAIAVGLARAQALGDGVALARDLINTPAGDLSPTDFAAIAQDVAVSSGLALSILEEDQIVAEGLGGLLGVAAGSTQPPRFVKATYEPFRRTDHEPVTVALVGKGITFDSGGLSLKTATGMMTMKTDMSGAAAVLGTLSICARCNIGVRVVGYMPLTENMPGGKAIKPGDVLEIRNGKTIEVLNTDAEGRLVLADALSLAVEDKPDAMVDLATLTGACVVALGSRIAGVMGNDDRLIGQIRAAGNRAGEALWPLPLPVGYANHIDSEIADMKNIGVAGQAGAISVALLLERFVADVPWVHLDIAGPARSDEDSGYLRKGATGFGVRTLIELLDNYVPCGGTTQAPAEGARVYR